MIILEDISIVYNEKNSCTIGVVHELISTPNIVCISFHFIDMQLSMFKIHKTTIPKKTTEKNCFPQKFIIIAQIIPYIEPTKILPI